MTAHDPLTAQEFFVKGKPPKHSTLNAQPGLLSVEEQPLGSELHSRHGNGGEVAGEITFPYSFPEAGSYRIWVQTKSQGKILTGVFDATVAAAK